MDFQGNLSFAIMIWPPNLESHGAWPTNYYQTNSRQGRDMALAISRAAWKPVTSTTRAHATTSNSLPSAESPPPHLLEPCITATQVSSLPRILLVFSEIEIGGSQSAAPKTSGQGEYHLPASNIFNNTGVQMLFSADTSVTKTMERPQCQSEYSAAPYIQAESSPRETQSWESGRHTEEEYIRQQHPRKSTRPPPNRGPKPQIPKPRNDHLSSH